VDLLQDLLVGLHFHLGVLFLVAGEFVVLVFGSFNLVEILFLVVCWLAAVRQRTWLDAEHHWDGDEHEDQQNFVDRLLCRSEEVHVLPSELQEVIDHN